MFFRSDWPEAGMREPLQHRKKDVFTLDGISGDAGIVEDTLAGLTISWVYQQNLFEENLYGFSVVNFWLEIENVTPENLNALWTDTSFPRIINAAVDALAAMRGNKPLYVASRLEAGSPLHGALETAGFEAVESRRLYTCNVADLKTRPPRDTASPIKTTTLKHFPERRRETAQREILDISREAFESQGQTRHFKDPVLTRRLPGIDYILAVMRLNFKHVDPAHFLLAVDSNRDRICGFSVVGKKPGLHQMTFSQLLSAVSQPYRGKGLYADLTRLMCQRLPPDAKLLNVTHAANVAIQKAYLKSGRKHLADTLVLRRYIH